MHPISQGLRDILSQKRNTQMTKLQTKQTHKHREWRAMAERKGGLARACPIYSIKIIKMTNVQNNKKAIQQG